ncbi:MAG TPA: regulatory protein RecX [Methylomirabilota bacterium]|nr:regulatory protein RecX [Methylomirabilota bacterium]
MTLAAARLAAADLLSRRPWTRAELARRLIRRGAPADIADRVIADLTDRGYLDDAAFALRWVQVRAGRGYGATRLRAELRARGVAAALIDEALAPLAAETELEQARALARRRLGALRRARPDRAAARLADYLARRGYRPAVASRVVRELVRQTAEG